MIQLYKKIFVGIAVIAIGMVGGAIGIPPTTLFPLLLFTGLGVLIYLNEI